jgi:hypothetical protein
MLFIVEYNMSFISWLLNIYWRDLLL